MDYRWWKCSDLPYVGYPITFTFSTHMTTKILSVWLCITKHTYTNGIFAMICSEKVDVIRLPTNNKGDYLIFGLLWVLFCSIFGLMYLTLISHLVRTFLDNFYDKISVTFFCFFIAGGENVRICSGLLCRLLVTLSHLLSLHISWQRYCPYGYYQTCIPRNLLDGNDKHQR